MKRVLLAVAILLGSYSISEAASTLTWNPNAEPDIAGYKVYRGQQTCAEQGPLQPLVVSGVPVAVSHPTVRFVDNNLPPVDGPVAYQVTAYDTAGNESAKSQCVSVTVNLNPPTAPTGVSATVTP